MQDAIHGLKCALVGNEIVVVLSLLMQALEACVCAGYVPSFQRFPAVKDRVFQ